MLDKFEEQSFLVIHLLGENATGAIARFCDPLAALLHLAGGGPASLSRLARKSQKRTLTPVQLRFLGLMGAEATAETGERHSHRSK